MSYKRRGTQVAKGTVCKTVIRRFKSAPRLLPGQFVTIRCGKGPDPLLRRPFAIHRVNREENSFEILYEVKGKGTQFLSQYEEADDLDILGPLGNGFTIDPKMKKAVLVAGGIGIAPLTFLAEELIKQGKEVCVILGSKTNQFASVTDKLIIDNCKLKICTEDGSAGQKGLSTDLLNEFVRAQSFAPLQIYACGPHPMLKAVAKIAKEKKIECQVSLEEVMACGIGACLGCAVKTKAGYKMVCKDGPVFNAEDIIW